MTMHLIYDILIAMICMYLFGCTDCQAKDTALIKLRGNCSDYVIDDAAKQCYLKQNKFNRTPFEMLGMSNYTDFIAKNLK